MKTHPHQSTYSTPFGMLVQERVYTATEYRFGFQGQEKDDEVSGDGNSNTAEYWQYDSRLGRRWNVDPLTRKYSSSSPFACFNNNPILFHDPLGLEGEPKGGSGTRRAISEANSIIRKLENDPNAGKDWNYSITWDNKRSGYTIQGENGNGGTMNQSGKTDKFFVKYTFKDRVSDFFSSCDAQVHSPEFESKATTIGQTITEFHPGVGLYNFTKGMGQKAGLWENGSNIWGEDQSNVSLALETVGVAGDFVKSGIKVLKIADGGGKGVSLNRLNHIFGNSEHALESLVTKFGSQEEAYNAVQNAANQALKAGKLTPNAKGILPSGDLGNTINVGGMNVRLIGGRVENGQVILSSFSRKGF